MPSYIGRDQQTHEMTNIDWDKTLNTKVSAWHTTDKEKAQVKKFLIDYRKSLVDRVLAVPAALAGELYFDFVTRDFDTKTISWNQEMLNDMGMPLQKLIDMVTMLEKRHEAFENNNLDLKTPQVKH